MKKTFPIPNLDIEKLQAEPVALPPTEKSLRYIGAVTHASNDRILRGLEAAKGKPVTLFITSTGGPTGVAMSFYDSVRHMLRPDLTTIGSGDVDSSGVIIFLAGSRRYLTARTTMLLHTAGRFFGSQRYTTREMASMLAEDRMKDEQYAQVLADNSRGKLTHEQVLSMMEAQTVLSPERAVALGLADAVLP